MEKRSNCVNVLTYICLRPGHGAPTYDVRKKKFTEHQLDHVQQAQVHKQYLYSEQLALFSSSELVGFGLIFFYIKELFSLLFPLFRCLII